MLNKQNLEKQKIINSFFNRYHKANIKKSKYEKLWQECYNFSIPKNITHNHKIFDATACDAVDELASILLSDVGKMNANLVNIKCKDLNASKKDLENFELAENNIMEVLQSSNFLIQLHQSFLDLIISGTASILIERSKIGESSPIKFKALPIESLVLEESNNGKLDITFRNETIDKDKILLKYPNIENKIEKNIKKYLIDNSYKVLECIEPLDGVYHYTAILHDGFSKGLIIKQEIYDYSPIVNFRWHKIAGENYGRSPMMKVLPDVKTANKIVELTLKNAAIAVSGIWQADDDGVINVENINLKPGAIITKSEGSKGLQPLETSGNFNLSQIILESLQKNIRKGLLTDYTSHFYGKAKTATEINDRINKSKSIIYSVYNRLENELFDPVAKRVFSVLKNFGFVKNKKKLSLNISAFSPNDIQRKRNEIENIKELIFQLKNMPELMEQIDKNKLYKALAKTIGIPENIIINNK